MLDAFVSPARNKMTIVSPLTVLDVSSPMRLLHEAPCHLISRLVDGTDSFDELRSATASQTGRSDHAVADIRVDTGHQKCADGAEMPALFLDGCAIGVAFAEFSCRERAREADLDDTMSLRSSLT